MKKIEAVISPYLLDDLRDALVAGGVDGMVVSEVGSSTPQSSAMMYRGVQYHGGQSPRIKVELVLTDEQFPDIFEIVSRIASSDPKGAEITVMAVEQAIRIRTGERGAHAVGGRPPRTTSRAA